MKTFNYYEEIKTTIINNEVTKRVKDNSKNKSDLTTYYNIGKLLSEAGKHYGKSLINVYSQRLTNEFGKGFSSRNLRNMNRFYLLSKKWQTLSAQLTWRHYIELLPFNNINKINYYISICETQNLSVRQLRTRIKNKEYERLDAATKNKLVKHESLVLEDTIKNLILINNRFNVEIITEKVLQKLILEDIPSFLKELGNSFCFISNEFPIKIGDNFNYIDLLLYNYEYNCYVVVELKVTEFKKEHIGQIYIYIYIYIYELY